MAPSSDVNLPRGHAALLPNRCVVCDGHSPNSRLWLVTGVVGWWSWVFWWWLGGMFSVNAPACRWCALKNYAVRVLSLLVSPRQTRITRDDTYCYGFFSKGNEIQLRADTSALENTRKTVPTTDGKKAPATAGRKPAAARKPGSKDLSER